ncbi:MAG: adenylate cyclase [Lachnospiraceae bacterium]|jgi:CYTH domain-containing protein|nr:adenylate cyclase [Lachnospiraceae bacterium]
MEIERKFTIKKIPDNLSQYKKKEIEQGYLSTKEPVIRIRKSNDNYLITYKSRLGMAEIPGEVALSCEEVELPLSQETYDHLKAKIDHHMIVKTRYMIPLPDGCIAELDIFHGILEGLVFVEVEFPGEEEAKKFHAPDWFGEDVSFDKRYKNNYLASIHSLEELFQ